MVSGFMATRMWNYLQVTTIEEMKPRAYLSNSIASRLYKMGIAEVPIIKHYHISGNVHNAYTEMIERAMCDS